MIDEEQIEDILSAFWIHIQSADDPIAFIDEVMHHLDVIRYSFEEDDEPVDMSCKDCGEDTEKEYYMVHNQLWYDLKCGDGFLCIGCLETRLGRELKGSDFTDAPVNTPNHFPFEKSERLLDRLGR